ncbi:MAG: hypothetical protein ACTSXF_05720 [Promethearchaeota archaeon]
MIFFESNWEAISFISSVLSGVIGFLMSMIFFQKNRIKKSETLKKLALVFLFLSLAAIIDFTFFTIFKLYPEINSDIFDFVSFGTYLSFSCNAISNIFFIAFTLDLFTELPKLIGKVITNLESLVVFGLMIIFFMGLYRSDIIYLPLMIHIACSFTIYVLLAVKALKLRKFIKPKSLEEYYNYQGLLYIAFLGIFLFVALSLFILHEVTLVLGINEFITVALGWAMGVFAALSGMYGYLRPEFVKESWRRSAKKKFDFTQNEK